VLYWVLKVILPPILRVLCRMRFVGRENIPRHGAAIIAANHLSAMDWIFIPAGVKRRKVTHVAKAEYFDSWKTRWFFSGTGQIPIKRDGGNASDGALTAAREVLENGKIFGIYPEGTRSPDGRLYRGKTGAARLALLTGADLVPAAVIGTDRALPRGKKLPRSARVTVAYGTPIKVERYLGWHDQRAACRALTDELMMRIAEMSGQEYVPQFYAADVKAALAEGRPVPSTSAAA
jgi:1-acyl-sn-glycerol-3-phosphate acyltransferase